MRTPKQLELTRAAHVQYVSDEDKLADAYLSIYTTKEPYKVDREELQIAILLGEFNYAFGFIFQHRLPYKLLGVTSEEEELFKMVIENPINSMLYTLACDDLEFLLDDEDWVSH